MTRTNIAKKLLEHGPLTFAEFQSITGWPEPRCRETIRLLQKKNVIQLHGRRGCYRLAGYVEKPALGLRHAHPFDGLLA